MNQTKTITTRTITIVALALALNYVGGTIALFLRLPIYLDTIGTIFAAVLLGPVYGVLAGLLNALLSGLTTDLFALYYGPVQIVTGFCAGYFLKNRLEGKQLVIKTLWVSLPGTIIATIITVVLFGGITSSGSSVIVQLLRGIGLSQVSSVFLVQVITDYLDRLVSIVLVLMVTTRITHRFMKQY
jgi:energy-coupling factor transport system substrate-specific component